MTLSELAALHLKDWETFREALFTMFRAEDLKEARQIADIIKLVQEGERRAIADAGQLGQGPILISWED